MWIRRCERESHVTQYLFCRLKYVQEKRTGRKLRSYNAMLQDSACLDEASLYCRLRLCKQWLLYFLYHNRVILVCLIFFWSWKMPYIRASDVGGPEEITSAFVSLAISEKTEGLHPGTYISTGTILSQPLVTE